MPLRLHASAFLYQEVGVLVLGGSGSGKSALCAQALLHGGQLIADDQVEITHISGQLVAQPPPELAGVLELRGYGLIRVAHSPHPLQLVFSLCARAERLAEAGHWTHEGISLPHWQVPEIAPSGAAAALLWISAWKRGHILPTDWRPGAR